MALAKYQIKSPVSFCSTASIASRKKAVMAQRCQSRVEPEREPKKDKWCSTFQVREKFAPPTVLVASCLMLFVTSCYDPQIGSEIEKKQVEHNLECYPECDTWSGENSPGPYFYARYQGGDVHQIPYAYIFGSGRERGREGQFVHFDDRYLVFRWPSGEPYGPKGFQESNVPPRDGIVIARMDSPGALPNGIAMGIRRRVEVAKKDIEARPLGVAEFEGPDGLTGYYDPTVPDESVAPAPRRSWPGEIYYPFFGGRDTVFTDNSGDPVVIECFNRMRWSNARCTMRFPYKEHSKIIVRFQYYLPENPKSIDAGFVKDWRAIKGFAEKLYDDTYVCNLMELDPAQNCGALNAIATP